MTRSVALRKLARGGGLFTDGDWVETPFITDSGVRLLQTGNIGVGHFREQGFRYISEESFQTLRCTEVLAGDVLISRLAHPVGRACLAPDLGTRMVTSVDVAILRVPTPVADSRYLNYWLNSSANLDLLDSIARGGTRQRVSRDQLGSVPVSLPDRHDQTLIADYLDSETARIDALITKKRAMETLLEEAWLADLRGRLASLGSDRVRLRYIAHVKRGQSPRPIDDQKYFDEGGSHGWVRIEDATRSDMYLRATTQRLSPEGRRKSVPVGPGVVLVSIAASVGKPIITAMDCCYHDGWVGLLGLDAIPEYIYFALLLPETFGGLGQLGTQTNVNSEIVGNVSVPLASRAAQRQFVAEALRSKEKWGQASSVLRRQIDLLVEHRRALVTSTLTGALAVPGVAG